LEQVPSPSWCLRVGIARFGDLHVDSTPTTPQVRLWALRLENCSRPEQCLTVQVKGAQSNISPHMHDSVDALSVPVRSIVSTFDILNDWRFLDYHVRSLFIIGNYLLMSDFENNQEFSQELNGLPAQRGHSRMMLRSMAL